MSELYANVGTLTYGNLLADPRGADKVALPMEPGNGTLARGTIVYRKTSGMWAPATTTQLTTSYALAVLDQAVNTDANLAVAEDAAAYVAGNFVRGKVILKAGSTITAAHELALRQLGIRFNPMQGTDTFDNDRTVITYKANNGATPTPADYLDYCDDGSTYTVLANTVTGFTAPSGKSFSKWNTKADGTGTDYAAAASYTASADLTLYAVWA